MTSHTRFITMYSDSTTSLRKIEILEVEREREGKHDKGNIIMMRDKH